MTMSDRVFVINRGVVQQVGSPYEIYSKPANQFVADFVGKVNFMKGTASNGHVTLNGIGKAIPYDGALKGNVIVTVRPENIQVVEKDNDALEGTLEKIYFLGNENDCFFDINGVTLRSNAPSHFHDTLKVGQKVYLKLKDYLVHIDDGNNDEITKIIT
jgi:iron(III) transport system ATP-binding protein